MQRVSVARFSVLVIALTGAFVAACEQKKAPPPQGTPYAIGSVVVMLPPSVQIPQPQGRPDAPTVNATKCNFVVDRQLKFMTEARPDLRPSIAQGKPAVMQECETKWTQEQYDCMVKAKSLEEIIRCKTYQRP